MIVRWSSNSTQLQHIGTYMYSTKAGGVPEGVNGCGDHITLILYDSYRTITTLGKTVTAVAYINFILFLITQNLILCLSLKNQRVDAPAEVT